MKRILLFTVVLSLFSGSVFASGGHGSTTNVQNANATAVQGMYSSPSQTNTQSVVSNPFQYSSPSLTNTYYSDYTNYPLPIQPGIANFLHATPYRDGIALWNGYDFSGIYLDGIYTREMVEYPLKLAGNGPFDVGFLRVLDVSKWFTECGKGFKKTVSPHAKYPATSQIKLRTQTQMIDPFKIMRQYERIAIVNVGGNTKLNFFLNLQYALKKGMSVGGELAIASGGMNHVMSAFTMGLGVGWNNVSKNDSVTATLGASTGSTKVKGEGSVQLIVFRKRLVALEESEVEAWYKEYAPNGSVFAGAMQQDVMHQLSATLSQLSQYLQGQDSAGAGSPDAVGLREKKQVINGGK